MPICMNFVSKDVWGRLFGYPDAPSFIVTKGARIGAKPMIGGLSLGCFTQMIGVLPDISYNRRHFSAEPNPKGGFGATGRPW